MQVRVSQTSRCATGNKEQRNILRRRMRAARRKILGENAQSQGQLSPKPKKRNAGSRSEEHHELKIRAAAAAAAAPELRRQLRQHGDARQHGRGTLSQAQKLPGGAHQRANACPLAHGPQRLGQCSSRFWPLQDPTCPWSLRPAGEGDALLLAKACCIQVGHLNCRVSRCCRSTFASCVNKGSLPLRASDGQVKCSRLALKGRDKDVRWPPTVHSRPLWKKQATALLFRLQTSSVSPTANEISESMMPMVSFAPSDADSSMQGKLVKNAMRAWTPPVIEGFG